MYNSFDHFPKTHSAKITFSLLRPKIRRRHAGYHLLNILPEAGSQRVGVSNRLTNKTADISVMRKSEIVDVCTNAMYAFLANC